LKVTGIGWLGVYTEEFAAMDAFVRDVLGLEMVLHEPEFSVFRCPNGDKVEVFGPGGPQPSEQFAANGIVAGFFVDDMEEARRTLEAAGIELVGPLQTTDSGYAWQHFRGPDGRVYELTHDPARSKAAGA
jgi:catechol 2,3-dioxygenase-like lactoylglutathione lyase family enzyme